MSLQGRYDDLQCCRGVVDPITLLAVIGGIGGVTYILYRAVTAKITGRKKRSVSWFKELSLHLEMLVFSGELIRK
jgi:hypothetical protein